MSQAHLFSNVPSILEQFSVLEDPRIDRHKKYPLSNILFFTFIAIMSDQQSWYQIADFSQVHLAWFSSYIDTSSGVPSHDTFRRVFSLINPFYLESEVISWLEGLRSKSGVKNYRVIALDGKALKGVPWKINQAQLYILNAWDAQEERFLGQLTIDEKSNEITAAP